jgi:integrase
MPVHEDLKCKNKDAAWYFQFYTGKVKPNGVRERITRRGFKSEKIAKKEMAACMTAHFKEDYIEPSKLLYSEYIKDWLKNKRKISEETRELYESYLRTHLIPLLGNLQISKITAHHIDNFITELESKGLAKNTIKRIFSVVNASLNSAALKDVIVKNVALKVEKPRAEKKQLIIWEPDYVIDFLEKTEDESRYWIVIYLAVMTGMRQGEILGLRWSDIDFENRTLSIQQTVTRKRKIKPGAKNKVSARAVALSNDTIKALQEHRKTIVADKLKAVDYLKHDLVVCTTFGGPATCRAIQKVWDRLITKYKAPKITFHDLRHTHASLLIKQGVHIKVISERLGHSSVAITMDLYGHLMQNMQSEAADGLDSLLKKKLKAVK